MLISTKEELKKAINNKETDIILTQELTNQLEPLVKIAKMSPGEKAAIITAVTVGGTGFVAAAILAIPTAGTSLAIALPIFALTVGILSAGEILLIAFLAVLLGVVVVVAIFNGYDIGLDGERLHLTLKNPKN